MTDSELRHLTERERSRMVEILALEQTPERAVILSDSGARLHPVAQKVETQLRKASHDDERGGLRCLTPSLPVIRVSPEGLDRAVRLIDAICRLADARSWVWRSNNEKPGWGAELIVEGEAFAVRLDETIRRTRYLPTPAERAARAGAGGWDAVGRLPPIPGWTFHPSGDFAIRDERGSTALIRDSANATIEAKLAHLGPRLIELAFQKKSRRNEQHHRAVTLERLEARRATARQIRELQAEAKQRLKDQATQWDQADRLRRFIVAAAHLPMPSGSRASRDEWVTWATAEADAMDPIGRFDRLLYREVEVWGMIQRLEAEAEGLPSNSPAS